MAGRDKCEAVEELLKPFIDVAINLPETLNDEDRAPAPSLRAGDFRKLMRMASRLKISPDPSKEA